MRVGRGTFYRPETRHESWCQDLSNSYQTTAGPGVESKCKFQLQTLGTESGSWYYLEQAPRSLLGGSELNNSFREGLRCYHTSNRIIVEI